MRVILVCVVSYLVGNATMMHCDPWWANKLPLFISMLCLGLLSSRYDRTLDFHDRINPWR